ncbi:MAG: hypothetical protein ABI824_16820, partial [Acidobacteriota bacterium]
MKIRYYSPMPPAPTGVADYSAELLPYLKALGEVDVNPSVDGTGIPVYHVGNNGLHREIYQRAVREPGIVVLHDALLQHFLLGTLDPERYAEEFSYNYGESSRALALQLWQERGRSGSDPRYFEHPMLKRIATTARAIIVHNPAAVDRVRQHQTAELHPPVIEIAHYFTPPALPSAIETAEFRRSLGLAPETLLVGTFGHQRETKRPASVLRGFHRAVEAGANIRLLFSGSFVSAMLEPTLATLLDHPRIIRTGHLSETDFWRYASATDLCVNLRYPSAAESSGIAVRLMGIGKAVAFTDGPAIARIPQDACLRIDHGAGEERMLTDYLVWLAQDPARASAIGQSAAKHIAAYHR